MIALLETYLHAGELSKLSILLFLFTSKKVKHQPRVIPLRVHTAVINLRNDLKLGNKNWELSITNSGDLHPFQSIATADILDQIESLKSKRPS